MILEQIVADNKEGLEFRKRLLPLDELKQAASEQPKPLDFGSALQGDGVQLIAEVKKASPSKGVIRSDFNPVEIAGIYADNGAAAISVITDTMHFQGSLDYLRDIKSSLVNNAIPLLRKDFIFDPYQVYESRAYGADCILLIVAILDLQQLRHYMEISYELGMKCLVEVHNESELETAIESGARIIGINNRNLKTFAVSLNTTERLRPLIPPDCLVVSESGIKSRNDITRMKQLNVNAVLVGETLMSSGDIAAKMKDLL